MGFEVSEVSIRKGASTHRFCVCAGLLDCLKKTVARGGPMALYQGFGVSVQVRAVDRGHPQQSPHLDHLHDTII